MWNYRVMKKRNESGEDEFGIYEVYYDNNGNIKGWTENSLVPVCTSKEALLDELNIMQEAFEREVLIYK